MVVREVVGVRVIRANIAMSMTDLQVMTKDLLVDRYLVPGSIQVHLEEQAAANGEFECSHDLGDDAGHPPVTLIGDRCKDGVRDDGREKLVFLIVQLFLGAQGVDELVNGTLDDFLWLVVCKVVVECDCLGLDLG